MTPYSETLIAAIKVALEGISTVTGYSMNVKNVQMFDARDLNTIEKPCIHIHHGRENRTLDGGLWNVQLELEFLLYLFDHEQPDAPTVVSEKRAGEDVLWCLANDVNWGELRALMISQAMEPFVDVDDETTESGVLMTVVVDFLVDRLSLSQVVDPDRSDGP